MADGRPGRPAKHAKGHEGDAVDHCLRSGKTQAGCAADLGIPKRTLGKWARARKLTEPERAKVEETRELRKEAGRLRTGNEFPKEAAALLPASQAQARGCDWRARRGRASPSGRCAGCRSRRDPAPATGRGAPRRPSRAPRPRCEPRRDGRGCPLGTSGAPARYGHGPWGLTPARRCTGCASACVSRSCGARARTRPGVRPSPTRGRRRGPT